MENYIDTPTLGEILNEEFLEPLGISAYKLAKDINVPTSRVQDILHNRRKITVDTSLRLAKYFGVSMEFLLTGEDCNYTPIDLPKIEILDKDTSEAITLLRKAISLLQK